ncbi:MAG: roadblock/LC7 domain-containing protein [Candidatus Aquicultorales bacterium]
MSEMDEKNLADLIAAFLKADDEAQSREATESEEGEQANPAVPQTILESLIGRTGEPDRYELDDPFKSESFEAQIDYGMADTDPPADQSRAGEAAADQIIAEDILLTPGQALEQTDSHGIDVNAIDDLPDQGIELPVEDFMTEGGLPIDNPVDEPSPATFGDAGPGFDEPLSWSSEFAIEEEPSAITAPSPAGEIAAAAEALAREIGGGTVVVATMDGLLVSGEGVEAEGLAATLPGLLEAAGAASERLLNGAFTSFTLERNGYHLVAERLEDDLVIGVLTPPEIKIGLVRWAVSRYLRNP